MNTLDPAVSVWVDGELIPREQAVIPVTDPAFLSGTGLFETMALRTGVPLEQAEHLDRLKRSAARLDIPLPEQEVLCRAIVENAGRQRDAFGWLRLVVTGSGRCAIFTGALDESEIGKHVSALLLPWRRNPHEPLAGLKTLNYAHNVQGIAAAAKQGADEGLWLNTRGHLAEGCTSNLFVVQRRTLYTASTRDGILPGVIRDLVIRIARESAMHVHIGKIRLRRLERADEAFLTSSLRGIRPLIRFANRPVGNGCPGPLTGALAKKLDQLRLSSAGLDH
jgi:branched-chain amino acid aminotransferase